MKVKQQPEDFQVDELSDVQPSTNGTYSLFRLTKKNLGTPEAVQQLCQGLRLTPQRVSFGGFKDTHALTTQHLTIAHGPRRSWRNGSLQLTYLGQVSEPFQPHHIQANQFTIRLRDFTTDTLSAALQELAVVATSGVANYFDDQRFGSVSGDGQFVARRLIANDFEGALQLALCAPYAHDGSAEKKIKQTLRSGWGDWVKLKTSFPRGLPQRVVAHLAARPQDFRGAVLQLPQTLLMLYMSAYQSHLWNRMLERWFVTQFPRERLVAVQHKTKTTLMPGQLTVNERERLTSTQMPLPSARLKLETGSLWQEVIDSVMLEEGLPLSAMKLKHVREVFFSKGERAVWFVPQGLTWQSERGEQPTQQHLRLHFTLPRGCYATMLIKRVTFQESGIRSQESG